MIMNHPSIHVLWTHASIESGALCSQSKAWFDTKPTVQLLNTLGKRLLVMFLEDDRL